MGETGTPDDRLARRGSAACGHFFLPRSASIIEAFQGDPRQDETDHPILRMAAHLAAGHRDQWAEENVSRCAAATAEEVAASKQRIDGLNAQRVTLVEQIDLWVLGQRVPGRPGAPLHTETLGSVVDRLSIAWVRTSNLIRIGGDRERARIALHQLAELADAYDDLVCDVESASRRLPTWRPLKTYAEPTAHG